MPNNSIMTRSSGQIILKLYVAICFLSLLFVLLPLSVSFSADSTPSVKQIEILGSNKIETSTIQANIQTRTGSPFSQKTVQNDIKALYGLGYFEDVKVEIESFEGGIKLIYTVKEKPLIMSIDFYGNDEIETDDLKEKITISPGAIANIPLIMSNVENIVAYYHEEGYWHAKVVPIIRDVSEASVAVTFQIEEGPEVIIDDITIEGNNSISTKKIKKAMKTREHWLFSFLTGSGVYKEDEMKIDVERIRELYGSKGFIRVVISEPVITLNDDQTEISIKINLSEGDQYKVGQISFTDNTLFESSVLLKKMETSAGKIFDRSALRRDIDGIIGLYTERGYATADINPLMSLNEEEKSVALEFVVSEGNIFRIGRIEISGNQKTRDKIIRREVRLDEGQIFNSKLIKRSYQRINNLDYFETVELTPKPLMEEQLIDIDVKVKEKLTGMLTVGGGYSSVDNIIFMAEITQRNLFGKGLQIKLKADISGLRTNYNITLINPWFMDKPLLASINVFQESFEYPDYEKKSIGGTLGFGKELSEYVGANISYSFQQTEISGISDNASVILKDQEGTSITSSLHPGISRDSRDNYIDPSTGSKNSLRTTYAGIGGDNYFVKGVIDSAWFFPVIWNTTFGLRGRIGYVSAFNDKELPIYERFYIGGIDTVRGLDFGDGGPKTSSGVPYGGRKELIFNAEYIFPIETTIRLKGVVFFDAGRSSDDFEDLLALRTTAGAGLRWISPFGPIRLEWGYNLDKKEDESSSKIEFAMGGSF